MKSGQTSASCELHSPLNHFKMAADHRAQQQGLQLSLGMEHVGLCWTTHDYVQLSESNAKAKQIAAFDAKTVENDDPATLHTGPCCLQLSD